MPKDLLPDLLSSRSNESYENDLGDNFDIEPMPHDNVDDFFLEINDMQQSLSVLKDLIKDIKDAHAAILKAPAGQALQDEDKKGLEDLVNRAQFTMTQLKTDLKDLSKTIKDLEKSRPGNYAEVRIKKNQHAAISKELADIIREYESIQSENKSNIKNKLIKLLPSGSSSDSDSDSDGGKTREFKDIQEDMEATRDDILDLEKKIESLKGLFADIHIFVDEQNHIIDSIEINVGETASHVEQAIVDTKKAVRYQSSARKKQVVITLCCFGILAAILVPIISQNV